MKEIARERTFTWTNPIELAKQLFSAEGISWLRAMKARELPPPPMFSALGIDVESVEQGTVAFSMRAEEWMCNPAGVVHGGMTATLLDTV